MTPSYNSKTSNFKKILKTEDNSSHKIAKKNIQDLQPGDFYKGIVKILRKVKPGPLILSVYDGSGTIDAIGRDSLFDQPSADKHGIKTYNLGNIQIKDSRKKTNSPQNSEKVETLTENDILVDDVVEISGKVNVHKDHLEIEMDAISRAYMDFDALIQSRSKPLRDTFSIPSERYDSMKQMFLNIAQRIRFAINNNQPIVIRHHNDADGICAGLMVEKAIGNVMDRKDLPKKNRLYRSPNVTPFYDQIDLFRDISKFNKYTAQFGDKSPLIVILDTGSTPENVFALTILKNAQFDCVVVDHHNPGPLTMGKSAICELVQFHLNPYLKGWDSQTCGGMLAYELARFIDEELEDPIYPAVAAIGDRCDIPEVDLLIKNTDKQKEEITQMGKVLDYLAYHLKFDPGEGLYNKVFEDPSFVKLIFTEVQSLYKSRLNSMIPNFNTTQINNIWYTEINLENYTQRGKFPTSGRVLGLGHDHIVSEKSPEKVLTIGYFGDGIILRSTHPVLPVPDLLHKLQTKFPSANIDGGGHENAGSIKFIASFSQNILQFIKDELKQSLTK